VDTTMPNCNPFEKNKGMMNHLASTHSSQPTNNKLLPPNKKKGKGAQELLQKQSLANMQ